MNVAFAGAFLECAPQNQRRDGPGDQICKRYTGEAAQKRDNECFSQELKQNRTLNEYGAKNGDMLLLTSTFVAGVAPAARRQC